MTAMHGRLPSTNRRRPQRASFFVADDARGWRALPALAALGSLLVLLVLAAPLAAADEVAGIATVTAVSGTADILRANGRTEPARLDSALQARDGVRTAADGKVELRMADGSLLRLAENTEVRLASVPEKRGLSVVVGRIWAKVVRVLKRSKFEVETPTAVAGVRGTILRVTVDESGEADFAVDEGEIDVYRGPKRARLRAMMWLRAGKGRWQPRRFDPAKRRAWEFWTDPIVTKRLAALKAEADRQIAEGRRIQKEMDALHQALAVDLLAARRLTERAERWRRRTIATAQEMQRLRDQKAALDRDARKLRPRVAAQRRAAVQREMERLAATASDLARELEAINTAAERGREARQKHLRALGPLLDDLKKNVRQREELARRIAKLATVRRADPHWGRFRPAYDDCEEARERLKAAQDAAYRLVRGEKPGPKKPPLPLGIDRRAKAMEEDLTSAEGIIKKYRPALDAARGGPRLRPQR